jgi:hypothetical protein
MHNNKFNLSDLPRVASLGKSQLASFENYLLSPEREKNLINHPTLMNAEQRSQNVHHADVENWKTDQKK